MGVMPGFKQSTIGVIPKDWEVASLAQLIRSVEYGSSAKSKSEGRIPVLRMGNLQGGKIDWAELVYTDDPAEINKYELRPGDVLFNRTNTIDLVGKTGIYQGEQPAIFAGYLIRINVIRERLDSRFLNYVLNTEFSRKFSMKVLSVAVGQANINGQKLKTYPIPLPPTRKEQESIANALSDVDAMIESLEQLLAKKNQIKQGAMQMLLTGKKRLPGFDVQWEETQLGAIVERIVGGGTPSRSVSAFWGGEIPWMTVKDFADKNPHGTIESITKEGLAHSASRLIPSGTVITSTRMVLGKAVVFDVDVAINQDLKAIFPVKDISPQFLRLWFKKNERRIAELGSGSTVMGLSLPELRKISFSKPPLPEQEAIAAVLTDMDTEIAALDARLAKARQLKQGMMQVLLTGRIRLPHGTAGSNP
ncbi:restriction endonuclease subunit S [Pseudoxanthomonas beigongshangi]